MPSLVTRLLLGIVAIYRRWLSPLKARPTCRFLPTCSAYAAEALTTHGAARGSALAAARVLRCNPLFHGGYHPVPARRAAMGPSSQGCRCHG